MNSVVYMMNFAEGNGYVAGAGAGAGGQFLVESVVEGSASSVQLRTVGSGGNSNWRGLKLLRVNGEPVEARDISEVQIAVFYTVLRPVHLFVHFLGLFLTVFFLQPSQVLEEINAGIKTDEC